jgi:hypothetical protein
MKSKAVALSFFILFACSRAAAQGPMERERIMRIIQLVQESSEAAERKLRTQPAVIRAELYSPASDSDLARRAVALFPTLDPTSVFIANHLKAMGLKDAKKYGSIFWLYNQNQDGKSGLFINADGDLHKDNQFIILEQVLRGGNSDAIAIVGGWIASALEQYSAEAELRFLISYRTGQIAQNREASELLEEAIEQAQKAANKEKEEKEKRARKAAKP